MAIPFFEPHHSEVEPVVDQVDGHGPQPPTPAIPIPVETTNPPEESHEFPVTSSPSEQQVLAWKILAVAMCKALKEYYRQTASSKDAFTSAVVQVLPNGQVQPLWK